MKILPRQLNLFKSELNVPGHYLNNDRSVFVRFYVTKQLVETLFHDLITKKEILVILAFALRLITTRGNRSLIEKFSGYQDDIVSYISAEDKRIAWQTLQGKLPKCISRLKSLKHFNKFPAVKQAEIIRLMLTLTNFRRLVAHDWKVSLDPIIEVRHVNKESVRKEFREFLNSPSSKQLCKTVMSELAKVIKSEPIPKFHFVAKSGPNGDTRLSRHLDEDAVLNNGFDSYLSDYSELTGQPEPILTNFNVSAKEASWIGRLSIKTEFGKKKNRVFAIFDGVSQETLKPMHDALMKTLQGIREDCTYDQTKISFRIKQLVNRKINFFGDSDLSQATDTIPR